MKKYNPRYDTKIQPFNISIINKWIGSKNLSELKQWLNEGEPHKRLFKEAISSATTSEWLDGLKVLFEKDWVNLDSKIKNVVDRANFCKKDDVLIFIRDLIFSEPKFIKKFSFDLFWAAKENGKDYLFDEDEVDFSHENASSLLAYRYMFLDKNADPSSDEKRKEKRDYLLSKGVLFIPYQIEDLLNFRDSHYLVELFKKHKGKQIFRQKEELFVFACVVATYYQNIINHAYFTDKSEEIKEQKRKEQRFMLEYLLDKGVMLEMDLTPKMLEKYGWMNHNLSCHSGDFFPKENSFMTSSFGALHLIHLNKHSSIKHKIPGKQKIKLAWYWIGGDLSRLGRYFSHTYVMDDDHKNYAEREFEILLAELKN